MAAVLTGCAAPPLSPAASKVHVYTEHTAALDKCQRIGPIQSQATSRFWRRTYPRLELALREEVAKAGGDTVMLVQRDNVDNQAFQHGIAYKCF
jgi:hypothetical protein